MVRKCPHLVRHGKVAADGKSIEFKDMCGLMIRKVDPDMPRPKLAFDDNCSQVPFEKGFDYISCCVYQAVFKSAGMRNDVNPTSEHLAFGAISSATITDMDLL